MEIVIERFETTFTSELGANYPFTAPAIVDGGDVYEISVPVEYMKKAFGSTKALEGGAIAPGDGIQDYLQFGSTSVNVMAAAKDNVMVVDGHLDDLHYKLFLQARSLGELWDNDGDLSTDVQDGGGNAVLLSLMKALHNDPDKTILESIYDQMRNAHPERFENMADNKMPFQTGDSISFKLIIDNAVHKTARDDYHNAADSTVGDFVCTIKLKLNGGRMVLENIATEADVNSTVIQLTQGFEHWSAWNRLTPEEVHWFDSSAVEQESTRGLLIYLTLNQEMLQQLGGVLQNDYQNNATGPTLAEFTFAKAHNDYETQLEWETNHAASMLDFSNQFATDVADINDKVGTYNTADASFLIAETNLSDATLTFNEASGAVIELEVFEQAVTDASSAIDAASPSFSDTELAVTTASNAIVATDSEIAIQQAILNNPDAGTEEKAAAQTEMDVLLARRVTEEADLATATADHDVNIALADALVTANENLTANYSSPNPAELRAAKTAAEGAKTAAEGAKTAAETAKNIADDALKTYETTCKDKPVWRSFMDYVEAKEARVGYATSYSDALQTLVEES